MATLLGFLAMVGSSAGAAVSEIPVLSTLLMQFVGLTPLIWACTEFLAPHGAVYRRVFLVVYAWVFSFSAYVIGIIKLPDVVVPQFKDTLWVQVLVVCVFGLGSAVTTHVGHEFAKRTFGNAK